MTERIWHRPYKRKSVSRVIKEPRQLSTQKILGANFENSGAILTIHYQEAYSQILGEAYLH